MRMFALSVGFRQSTPIEVPPYPITAACLPVGPHLGGLHALVADAYCCCQEEKRRRLVDARSQGLGARLRAAWLLTIVSAHDAAKPQGLQPVIKLDSC